MELHFAKWHGTGNDFIIIDDRRSVFPGEDLSLVQRLCHRHFGIGSDGLILIQPPKQPPEQFHMEFFNPDGSKSFCGNGSRCAYAFWSGITGVKEAAAFTAIDGLHIGRWNGELVSVTLKDAGEVKQVEEAVDFIHTGSPHELVWVEDPAAVDLMVEGPRRRYAERDRPGGTNVNFITVKEAVVNMRTYERGVEAETLSCGTGVVAAALAALHRHKVKAPVRVMAPGGTLLVQAVPAGLGWREVVLTGPAVEVFKGTITI